MTAYGSLATVVRDWSRVNAGELNRMQVRELLKALDALHDAEQKVQDWAAGTATPPATLT